MARPYNYGGGSYKPKQQSTNSWNQHAYGYSSNFFSGDGSSNNGNNTSLVEDFVAFVKKALRALVKFWRERGRRMVVTAIYNAVHQIKRNLTYNRILSVPHLLVGFWVVVLLWGERWTFHSMVENCAWENWENWPAGAQPHRVALVADPQLIDPHSYPGRPWPIQALTIKLTDNYMKRGYGQLQEQLDPDSVFFLGDLFDGGREWKTAHGDFRDPSWGPHPKSEQKYLKSWNKHYGEFYWLKEYGRFGEIFIKPWIKSGMESGKEHKRRKFVTSLPGNHDLGFGAEIKVPVRNRFETYFGEGNRVDVVGNHTFVSVDSVSMSAEASPEAAKHDLKPIYMPTKIFLDRLQWLKPIAVEKELRMMRGEVPEVQFKHRIEEVDKANFKDKPSLGTEKTPELPTILLSHVPLYRPPGTPCGPLRERHPPAKPPKGQTGPVVPDHGNAISVSRGYQYQNVLDEQQSISLLKKVGNVVHAFSGDDHDYCELVHSEEQRRVKEITVKSISMAMGVNKPGFVLVSLWNPLDSGGKPLNPDQKQTLQTHLCILPSQLSTYIRYVGFAIISVIILVVRAFLVPVLKLTPFALEPEVQGVQYRGSALLPVFKAKVEDYDEYGFPSSGLGSSRSGGGKGRDRSGSSVGGHGHSREKSKGKWRGQPRIEIRSDEREEEEKWRPKGRGMGYNKGKDTVAAVVVREMWTTIWRVTWMVLGWFGWLNW
ncbi:hypothetical protein QC762_108850 [Podospora pseudocomata]|uniref:Calcineurin-like phosphoesterase domain-containing protein n=1 Tax=Podospora pseudocomata TaxID=2093779 RepID=A0ABR0GUH1_9PEZI|nr:hypothetical protein QC762_108850 [Podospora pseudocomata]